MNTQNNQTNQQEQTIDFKANVKANYSDAPDEMINSTLAKFNFVEAAIRELSEKYMILKVADPKDKENYKLCHIANMDIKAKISAVGDLGKKLRADAIKEQKTVIAVEKTIVDMLTPIKIHLEAQKAVVDDEKKRIEEEKEKSILDRYRERAGKLAAVGMIFNGVAYHYLTHMIQADSLKTMEEDFFNAFLRVVESDFKAEENRKAGEAEKIRLQNLELQKQREDMAALKKQNDELLKQKADLAKQKKEMREERIFNLGFSFDGKNYVWNKSDLIVPGEFPEEDEKFNALVEDLKGKVKEREVLRLRTEERIKAVTAIGFSTDGARFFSNGVIITLDEIMNIVNDDWSAFLVKKESELKTAKAAKEKADQDALLKSQKEAKEAADALLDDKGKLLKWVEEVNDDLSGIGLPDLKARVSKTLLNAATSKINEALSTLKKEVKKLS